MSDADQIARRAVDTITMIAGKAAAFSTRILAVTTVVCVGSFLLGLAALSGGIESVWIVLGIAFGAVAVGAALVARWRVGAVRRHVPELVAEIRTLVTEGRDSSRTVIEAFVRDPDGDGTDGVTTGSAIVLSRRMSGFRGAGTSALDRAGRLAAAIAALTTFPLLALLALAITLVFGFLGFVFLVALAL